MGRMTQHQPCKKLQTCALCFDLNHTVNQSQNINEKKWCIVVVIIITFSCIAKVSKHCDPSVCHRRKLVWSRSKMTNINWRKVLTAAGFVDFLMPTHSANIEKLAKMLKRIFWFSFRTSFGSLRSLQRRDQVCLHFLSPEYIHFYTGSAHHNASKNRKITEIQGICLSW